MGEGIRFSGPAAFKLQVNIYILQARRAAGLAMWRGGRRPDQGGKPPQGRANSEPRNVAPQGEAAAEAPKSPDLKFKTANILEKE